MNSSTYVKVLSKGLEANLPGIEDGKLRFTTDTGRLFLDSDDKRTEITDFVKGLTEEQILATQSPLPKFYLSSDTNLLYFYNNGQWNSTKVDIGLATTESNGLMPALLNGDSTKYLRSDGTWADAGNTKHVEIERNAYEALSDEEKRNNKFYMVKDKIEDPALPAHIGYYFKIDNSRLDPSVISSEPRWCFNSTDAVYMYRKYGIHDPNFSVPTGGPGWGPNVNYLITSNMPLNNCYLITTYAIYGLTARGMIFIPKYIIDNGIGCLTRNGFYSKEDFQYYYIEFWGAWDDETNYSTIGTYTFTAGLGTIYPTGAYCTSDRISFCNIPYLVGYDFVAGGQKMQDSLDAYLADRSYSNFPDFYQANYLLFNGAMREYDGTLMLNDVDYTGRIDTSKYALKSELSGYASTADLAGKQDTLVAGENITIENNVISATGGGDTNYVELTQAEYNALTPEEKQNGTLYFITDGSGGGGGSTVIPNPIGEPAGTLNTIGINNIIYDIPGSGEGSSQTIAHILWSGSETVTTAGLDITLSHSVYDYDFITFTISQGDGYDSILTYPVADLTNGESYINTGYGGASMDVYFDLLSDTTMRISASASAYPTIYKKVVGLKICGTLAPIIYSFEEREIGAWVDDKPLYQKSYELGTAIEISASGTNIESYIDNLTDIECFIEGESAYTGSTSGSNGKQGTAIFVGYINGVLKAYCSEGTVATIITLRYTKTADVAGSGKYGSLGVPMKHYDGEERVVGTYFGETLYQKSYTNFSSLSGSSRILDFGLSDIDKIWYVPEGCVLNDGQIPFPYTHWDPQNTVGGFWDLNSGSPQFNFRTGSSSSNVIINVFTIQYTKSTT